MAWHLHFLALFSEWNSSLCNNFWRRVFYSLLIMTKLSKRRILECKKVFSQCVDLYISLCANAYRSQKLIVNIDYSSMLSSLTLMMHQFYIKPRKHWWFLDVRPMFHPCFQCFSTLKPKMFHRLTSMIHSWKFDKSSIKQQWITNEEITRFRCSTADNPGWFFWNKPLFCRYTGENASNAVNFLVKRF